MSPQDLNPEILIEDDVQEILRRIQQVYPDAFLAGGYLRDRALGIPAKDVDFFTFMPLPEGIDPVPWDEQQSGGGDIRISAVERWTYPEDISYKYPVEIIHFRGNSPEEEPANKDPLVELNHFLFGCQQIMYDGQRIVTFGPFWSDIEQKRMTVQRCANMIDAGIGLDKWRQLTQETGEGAPRYPGWKLAIPIRFQLDYSQHVDFTDPEIVLCD